MGPAILLCPSSSAVHLWGYVSPLKNTRQKEGSISLSHGYPRCSANAQCTGDSKRRHAFSFCPASSSEKCRKPNYPFAWRRVSTAAAGGEVSVEDAAVVSGEAPAEQIAPSEPPSSNEEAPVATEEAPAVVSEKAPVATERKTQARRTPNRGNSNANKAVVVSPAELLPGAVFPGKVTSIQSFGAFVDLGAFTNGLVHISRLSKSYVKNVEDVVQIGQEVKVQILEVDNQANRISLMLIEEGKEETAQAGEADEKQLQRSPQQQARNPRRDSSRRQSSQRQAATTTMKKGEIATGTVKNMIKSGVFVTLPDGTDGYLPAAEVVFKGPNTNMDAQFQIGQELTVRVLRIDKGRVNLTMKREMDYDKLNEDLNKGVIDEATNPFEIAFRRNELIARFLSDRDKQKAEAEVKEETPKEEAVNSVVEEKDVAEAGKPAAKEEVLNSVEEVKDAAEVEKPAAEVEVIDSVEEVKDAAEAEKPAAKEEVLDSVEEVKDAAEAEPKPVAEEEVSDSVEEVKDAAEAEPKSVAEEEEEKVANGVDAMKDDSVSSEAVSPLSNVVVKVL